MADPFADPHHRTRFAPSPSPSGYAPSPSPLGYVQPGTRSYPPQLYATAYDDHSGGGDMGYAGGVMINGQGQGMPWVAGEDDDERRPLTAG
jgi:hypothetical protein